MGYAIGAFVSGMLADAFGLSDAIVVIGGITSPPVSSSLLA